LKNVYFGVILDYMVATRPKAGKIYPLFQSFVSVFDFSVSMQVSFFTWVMSR
jgi:hypothetical protein